MTSSIRVGIIGAGANTTSKHIPGLQAIDGVEIVSICNRSRESSERVAKQFEIPTIYEDWHKLIEANDTDAIVIGTWPYMHKPMTLAALAADKHVMCEARMAKNAQEAQAMFEASLAKPHLTAQIVPSPFSLRVDQTIQRLITEGYLGDLLVVEIRALSGAFLDRSGDMHWRNDFDLSGFNIMSMGIWYEAALRWVGEATQVSAMGKTFVKMRKDRQSGLLRPVRIPDHINVLADLACGAQLQLTISSVTGLTKANEAWLFGSDGTLKFADNTLFGGQRNSDDLQEIQISSEEVGAWRVEEEFINSIRGIESITHTNFGTGVKYMEFTEAVTRSMQSGRVITLPLGSHS